jgi:hypothetical protein
MDGGRADTQEQAIGRPAGDHSLSNERQPEIRRSTLRQPFGNSVPRSPRSP